ncbi:hypothetical protein GCM10027578_04580 [Spirosoma luteolum]|jgi:hypothetical protein
MNTDNTAYDPADDDNQGVTQLMAQGAEATDGVSQLARMNPVTAQGPEPEKEEVAESDTDDLPVSTDALTEQTVEQGDVSIDEKNT